MSQAVVNLEGELFNYFKSFGYREPPELIELSKATQKLAEKDMQAAAEVTALISLIIKLTKAKRVIEVGTFTGYTTLGIALSLPKDGVVTTCESDPKIIKVGERAWTNANVRDKIDLQIGAALETLQSLDQNSYDVAFIDADKENYDNYYEECLRLVRPGGIIFVDNTLLHGEVANLKTTDERARVIHQLNKKIHRDERVQYCLIPMSDGLSIILKN